jgi:disulfide bond formation protein DsbB
MTSSAMADRPATKMTVSASGASLWTWAALAASILTLAGSLLLSLALGLKACPLCFYQRTFAMSVVAVLAMGLLISGQREGRLAWLALPLATAGLGVALFHVSLELRGKLECPAGVFGLGTAPQQSLAMFALLFVLLLMDAWRSGGLANRWLTLTSALVLGALLSVGSCIANPPMPDAPKQPYPKSPDVCRPPFSG